MRICVYCGSSDDVAPVYLDAARQLGTLLGERGHTLIYGGGHVGLMDALAVATQRAGGLVIGVIPRTLMARELAYRDADQLYVVETAAERKERITGLAEGFIVLPGGFGTLEELAEALNLTQLGGEARPLVLVDVAGFWAPLLTLLEQFYRLGFAGVSYRELYRVVAEPHAAVDWVERRSS